MSWDKYDQIRARFNIFLYKNIFQVQEAMQVTIEFKPRFYGDHQCDLIICHDTGEEIYVSLQGKI